MDNQFVVVACSGSAAAAGVVVVVVVLLLLLLPPGYHPVKPYGADYKPSESPKLKAQSQF